MKILICSIFLLCSITFLTAQKLQPTDKLALINFEVKDDNQKVVVSPIINIRSKTKGKSIKRPADEKGQLSILLPAGDTYFLMVEGSNMEIEFELQEGPDQTYTIPLPYAPIEYVEEEELVENSGSTEATLRIFLKDDNNSPVEESFTLTNKKTGEKIEGKTDSKGFQKLSVPNAANYLISFEGAPEYGLIEVTEEANLIVQKDIYFTRHEHWTLYPTYKEGLLNFQFTDLDKISNKESFTVTAQKSKKEYSCTTNEKGFAQLLVPLNETYNIKTAFNDEFDTLTAPATFFIHNIIHKSLSAEAREIREKEREAKRIERDSMIARLERKGKVDLLKASSPEYYENYGHLALYNASVPDIESCAKAIAAKYLEKLKTDPQIFVKQEQTVLAVLDRLKGAWKRKIVVTDITGSMSPYFSQVLIWHALNLIKDVPCKYVFFNDGDNHPDGPIGSSGGLYHCQGQIEDLSTIIDVMQQGTTNGYGGAGPENDIEALLSAIGQKKQGEEIILIADNYSKVRDMRLLKQINLPVRVILCGSLDFKINPQYLRIARKTKGSVHTMTEDINNLAELENGGWVKINGETYELQDGEFIHINR